MGIGATTITSSVPRLWSFAFTTGKTESTKEGHSYREYGGKVSDKLAIGPRKDQRGRVS